MLNALANYRKPLDLTTTPERTHGIEVVETATSIQAAADHESTATHIRITFPL